MDLTQFTPLTELRILSGIPLASDYTDTLSFASVSAQSAWFATKTKHHITNMSPVYANKKVRVPYTADSLYDCNYVMWKNANFSNKWFYGFITDIEWCNRNMSLITIEMDVLQSWYFDYDLNQCWIERQHASSDVIGENLVPENLELGEYVVNSSTQSNFWDAPSVTEQGVLSNWCIGILSAVSPTGGYAPGKIVGNMYSGLGVRFFSSLQQANDFINNITSLGKDDALISAYMFPNVFQISESESVKNLVKFNYSVPKRSNSLDGYSPKNNKLFTYPYCLLRVGNGHGSFAEYRQEFFTHANTMTFELSGNCFPDSELVCAPKGYKGMPVNYQEKITINGYPTVSMVTDYYKAWLAQYKSTENLRVGTAITTAVGGAVLTAATTATGGAALPITVGVGTAMSAISQVSGMMQEKKKAEIVPPQAKGTQSGSTTYGLGEFNFRFDSLTIPYQFAKRIDDYFSMFGYAVHDFGTPKRTGRQNWNYVKTVGCNATGSIPFNDIAKIDAIYDNGVRFWHTKDVGNFSLPNGIV